MTLLACVIYLRADESLRHPVPESAEEPHQGGVSRGEIFALVHGRPLSDDTLHAVFSCVLVGDTAVMFPAVAGDCTDSALGQAWFEPAQNTGSGVKLLPDYRGYAYAP